MVSIETLIKLSKRRKIRLTADESEGLPGSEWTFLTCKTIETPEDYPTGTYKITVPPGINGETQGEHEIGKREAQMYLEEDFSYEHKDEEIQAMLIASQQGPKKASGYYLGFPILPNIQGKVLRPAVYFRKVQKFF